MSYVKIYYMEEITKTLLGNLKYMNKQTDYVQGKKELLISLWINVIPTKMLTKLFMKFDKLILYFIWKSTKPRIADNFEKKKREES